AFKLAPILMLSSGGGTGIPLMDDVWTYHYGYKHGDDSGEEDLETNRKRTKSGRSYIDTSSRRTHDPSDKYFLGETMEMLESMEDPWPVYKIMFNILTRGDASGIEKLPEQAQTVVADWFGIYVAEQRRHRMTGWQKMDW